MKNFTQVDNSRDILRTLEGLKSRIAPFHSRFTLVALSLCTLLLLGGFTTRAWASATVTFNATNSSFSGSAPYTITQDSVTFSLNVPNWYNGGSGHFYIYTSNTTATIGWTPATGFTIAVTGVSLNGQNAQEKHWFSQRVGLSYIRSHTASDNTEVKISQNNTTNTYPFTTSNTNLFPGGSALGNSAYFKLRAEKGYSDADADNSYEYQINWATITYTVTPPAPTLKGASTVTRSQFVEGRSNNTVTLTDYFKPFNSGVSMSYVVKKKNGSGVYETINSGYTITSNVFKTTVVGEYQIFANSNATGAFIASASSPALAVTIEEVRPVTISVGSQELYVGGTTSMTITEQLNTTQPVNFEYDTNFFEYNTSTHVLTAKNIGNASFNTIEKSIRVTQATDGEFAAVDMNINFTIKKYPNVLSCSWGDEPWSKNLNFDEENGVIFSSNNDTGTPIVVTPGAGVAEGNGTYDAENHKVIAGHNVGSATWTISQAEDYKYQAAVSKTLTVNVGTIASPGCMLLENQSNTEHGMYGNTYHKHTWDAEHAAGVVTFEISKNPAGIDQGYKVQQYLDSDGDGNWSWEDVTNYKNDHSTSWGDWKSETLNEDAKGIRFMVKGSVDNYVRNVSVTRKKYVDARNTSHVSISSLNMPSRTRSGAATTATFYVDYSTCDNRIKLASNNPHITFANGSTSYQFDAENSGRKAITLNYTSTEAEIISATITIYTQYEHETLTVNAETLGKLSTTLEYIGSDSYSVNADNVAATSLFQVRDQNGDLVASPAITLSSSNTDAINTVSSNTAIDFLCGADDVRITASYAGDATYAAASNSGTFYHDIDVIKPNDVVTWNVPTAEDGTIHIKAKHDVPYSIATANTAIRFTTRNAAQLTVNAGPTIDTLRTVAHSQTPVWLVATTAGSCAYNSIKDSIQITVEPCYHEIIWNQTFAGLTTAADGTISEEYDLNAYAVDSNGVATNIDIIYSMPSVSFATLEGSHLTISGVGETTITATTDDDSKFATVVYPKTLKVRRYGEECESNALPESVAQEIAFENIVANTSNPTASTYYLSTPVDSLVYYVRKYASATTGSFELLGYDFATGEWRAMESGYGPGEVTTNSEGSRRVVHFEASDSTVRILKWESNADIGKIHWTHYQEGSKYILKAKAAPLKIFEVNRTSITRGELNPVMVNTPFDTTITLRYCDKPHINYTYTGSVLSVTTDKEINNDCGEYGTYTFRFRGEFTKTGRYQDTIFFKTSAGDSIAVPFDLHVYTSGEFNFDNTEGDWGTSNKWSYGASTTHGLLPTKSSAVTIEEPITISAEVEAYSVKILNDATVTILPGGGLTVGAGGIKNSSKTNFILQAGTEGVTKGKTGYLRISPSYTDTMPHAKVQMYSIGYYNMSSSEEDIASWQYIGTPIDFAGKLAKTVFTRSWIYSYQESTNSWVNNRKTLVMQPFVGYSTTQLESESGKMIEYPGQLIANRGLVTIDLEYTDVDHGHNLLANSFAAPIDITQFRTSDFINAERAIYIFNTGSKSQASGYSKSGSGDAAGQFRTIAIGSAAEMAERFAADPSIPTTIAPMQGFCVNAQAAGAQFKLDYERLVWNANYKSHAPTALRAPKRNADAAEEEEEMPITGSMKMTLEANGLTDNIYLLESERYMTDFEDGYDAHKMESGTLNIFTVENEDKLAIDATNSIIGTRVGVRTGEETAYTITFSYVDGEQEWALYDAETDEMIDITNDNTYTFFAEPNSNITERFMIVESNGAQIPAVTTGNDKVTSDVRAHKFIKDGELFILKNGVLYDVTGARVK